MENIIEGLKKWNNHEAVFLGLVLGASVMMRYWGNDGPGEPNSLDSAVNTTLGFFAFLVFWHINTKFVLKLFK